MTVTDTPELTVEQRVKKILSLVPSYAGDTQVIALTVALAHGGTRATRRIELIADDIAGVSEQQTVLRKQYTDLRKELEQELAGLARKIADEGEVQ